MRKILISFVTMSLVLATPQIICAEPSETIKHLMNEPASLFDLGLYRLNQELLKAPMPLTAKEAPLMRRIYAEYNWDLNRIEINIRYLYGPQKLPQNIKELITLDINTQKVFLGIVPSTGEPAIHHSRLQDYFTHLGYQKSVPKHLGKKLDQTTEFIAKVFEESNETRLIGRSPLLDENVYWSEVKTKTP